jgi:hypothetical protein
MVRPAALACAAILAGVLNAAPARAQATTPGQPFGSTFGQSVNQAAQQFGSDLARSATQLGTSAGRAADAFTRSLNQPYTVTFPPPTRPYTAYAPSAPPVSGPPRSAAPQPPPKFKIPRAARRQMREQARAPGLRWRGLPAEVIARLTEDQRGLMDAAQDKALDAAIGEELFWSYAGSSGYVRVVSEDRFGPFACRNFLHSITLAGEEKQGALTACRDTDGGWTQSF